MPRIETAETITIKTAKAALTAVDALATATAQTRDEIVGHAIDQYLAANAWQTARIEEGIAAEADGLTEGAETLLTRIAAQHGWSR